MKTFKQFYLTTLFVSLSINFLEAQNPLPITTGAVDGQYGKDLSRKEHFISKELAIDMITRYMDNRDKIQKGDFVKNDSTLPTIEAFNSKILKEILSLKGCIGIKYFYGLTKNSFEMKLIAFGVDEQGKLLLLKRPITHGPTERGGPGGFIEGAAEMTQKDPPMLSGGLRLDLKKYVLSEVANARVPL